MKTNSETERQIFILKEMLNDYMHNEKTQITDVEMLNQLANVVFNFGLEYYEYALFENIIDYKKAKNRERDYARDYLNKHNPFKNDEEGDEDE